MHRLILTLLAIVLLATALPTAAQTPAITTTLYVPIVASHAIRPLGFETNPSWLYSSQVKPHAQALNAHWVRLNTLSWREAQPTPTSPINWSASSFQIFEQEVLAANELGLQVMAIIDDHPSWATNKPLNCAPILDQYHAKFAEFVSEVVRKYSQYPYYVRYWELGNEPDVAVQLVGADIPYGCWGDVNDNYYGGERYGRMLQVVAPAIRNVDPGAKIVIGGLLLDNPGTNNLKEPADFFEGILRSGATPYFDIVAFHSYPIYVPINGNWQVDYDLERDTWKNRGGMTIGKIKYLREVMTRYGVSKPLFLNETGLRCNPSWATCGDNLYQMQANILIRSSIRAISLGVEAYMWYTLDGPGWQSAGLLDGNQQPKPAYNAMQFAIQRLNEVRIPPQAFNGYGSGLEAYRFQGNGFVLDVVWSVDGTPRQITLPASSFIAAYTRDGASITPTMSGTMATINVGFENIYLKRQP
ncbi:MAG: hypothetical protein KatS3mg109_1883 [Pirellulaceae bacterium]|nr:MAG: hypothetical protein KatS3mg109_1883 [Pirellulaceae bacterium]